jgi:hypothetical protein
MNNFKNFTEKISCRVIPIARDRRVWLDKKMSTMICIVFL